MKDARNDGVRFNGSDYVPERDDKRLASQFHRILTLMLDGQWRTLNLIQTYTNDPQASISAQLRHMRKKRFGGYIVEKKHRGGGLFEYRVLPPPKCDGNPHRLAHAQIVGLLLERYRQRAGLEPRQVTRHLKIKTSGVWTLIEQGDSIARLDHVHFALELFNVEPLVFYSALAALLQILREDGIKVGLGRCIQTETLTLAIRERLEPEIRKWIQDSND